MADIMFDTGVIYRDKLYFTANFNKCLAYIDLKDNKAYYINNIQNFRVDYFPTGTDHSYEKDGIIYFVGIDGTSVMIYDVESNRCESIQVNCGLKSWGNYALAAQSKHGIYLFPKLGNKIVKVDYGTNKVNEVRNILNGVTLTEGQSFECGCSNGETAWIFDETGKYCVQYHMISGDICKICLNEEMGLIRHAVYANGKIYILNSKNIVWRLSLDEEHIDKMLSFDMPEDTFGRIVITQQNMWLLPALGEEIYIWDYNRAAIPISMPYPKDFKYKYMAGWSKYTDAIDYHDYTIMANRLSNYVLWINRLTGEGEWKKPLVQNENDMKKAFIKNHIKNGQKEIISENVVSLEGYISYICGDN